MKANFRTRESQTQPNLQKLRHICKLKMKGLVSILGNILIVDHFREFRWGSGFNGRMFGAKFVEAAIIAIV